MSGRPDPFDLIRAELSKLEARPGLVKSDRVSFRDRQRCKVHAAFCAGIQWLLDEGWSMRRIAQHMEVDPVTLKDWFEQGDKQRSQLPGWVIAALPTEALPSVIRVILGWSVAPPSARTGTDG